MAESHAKLCFRQKVVHQDVLAAVSISEKYIRALFDNDPSSSPPEPKFTCVDDIEGYQTAFSDWLTSFTENINHQI